MTHEYVTCCCICNIPCNSYKEFLKHASVEHSSISTELLQDMKKKFWFCVCCNTQTFSSNSFWKHKQTVAHKVKYAESVHNLAEKKSNTASVNDLICLRRMQKYNDLKKAHSLLNEYFGIMTALKRQDLKSLYTRKEYVLAEFIQLSQQIEGHFQYISALKDILPPN